MCKSAFVVTLPQKRLHRKQDRSRSRRTQASIVAEVRHVLNDQPEKISSCRKRKNRQYTKHHVWPVSKRPELAHVAWNIKKVHHVLHVLFHQIFGNLTPPDVLRHVHKKEVQRKRAFKVLFGGRSLHEIILYIAEKFFGKAYTVKGLS